MAKIGLIKNNFTSGELSPHIWMRTDLKQYQDGCKEVFNMLPIVEGGIKRRGGTKLLVNAPETYRLIPFLLSHSKAYILSFRDRAVDVLTADGQLIRTLNTPYNQTMIHEISYNQDKYNLYLAHEDYPLAWIRISENLTNWDYSHVPFSVPPMDEVATPNVAIKPNVIDVGKIVTVTASDYEQYSDTRQYFKGDVVYLWVGRDRNYYKAANDTKGNIPYGNGQLSEYWEFVTVDEASAFRPTDVGKYIFINEGIFRIDTYISRSSVSGEILVKLKADIEAIAKAWVIKAAIFSSDLGYPRQVSMSQQRLILGGTKKYPNYLWFSRAGDITNFLPSTDDGDSFTVSASSDQLSNVLAISQNRGVVIFTGGAELAINSQAALSPTNANIVEHSSHGIAENIKPIKVGSELLFVQRGSDRLRTLIYDYSQDGLVSNELTVLASHIPEEHGGFRSLIYQQEPDSIVWAILNDGSLASLTLNREQSVISWARHDLGAEVLSGMTLPSSTGADRLYFLVRRNGQQQIEQLKEDLLLDSATNVTVINGKVTHPSIELIGDQIAAYYKDNNHIFSITITERQNDTLTLDIDPSIKNIYIGRRFTSRVSLFPPELQGTPATTLMSFMKLNSITMCLYKTVNPKVNGELVELKSFDQNLFEPPKPFSGFKRLEVSGWDTINSFKVEITQDEPLPLHITALMMDYNINER